MFDFLLSNIGVLVAGGLAMGFASAAAEIRLAKERLKRAEDRIKQLEGK